MGDQVSPVTALGSVLRARNESVMPVLATAWVTGQSTTKPQFFEVADETQSRCDGVLKSPARNTGTVLALPSCALMADRIDCTCGRRADRFSSARIWLTVV